MGTVATLDVRDDVPEGARRSAAATAMAELHRIDGRFSSYRGESEVRRLERGDLAADAVSDELALVLRLCEELRSDSGDAFGTRPYDREPGTAGPVTLDVAGVVKGWAIDRAGATLTTMGMSNWSVTVGGDVLVSGRPEADRPWQVAVVDPSDPLRILVTLALAAEDSPVAVATSGNYERGRHIWDPRTGRTVDRGGSFTVIGPSMTYADAYATIGFVLGEDGPDWVLGHNGYAAVLIGADSAVTTAPRGLL